MPAVAQSQKRVGVFWDVENCTIPSSMSGKVAVERIKSSIVNFGKLVEFNAYGDSKISKKWCDLRAFGVCFINTPHDSRHQVADMRIIADMLAFALGHTEPVTVILISCDGDYAHAISIIQDKGHSVWIICSNVGTSEKLHKRADGMMSWKHDVLERVPPMSGPVHVVNPLDEEDELEDKESTTMCCGPRAFASGFGQTSPSCNQPITSCQTSSSSFSATSRPLAVQTCFSPDGQSGLSLSYGSSSVITSNALSSPAGPSSVSSGSAAARAHPPKWRFFLLIKVLLELRASDPENCKKLKRPEVIRILRERDPSVFAEYKRPKAYLSKAQTAGVICMRREAKGQPYFVQLHPDYC